MGGRARSRPCFDSGMIVALLLLSGMHREGALRVLGAARPNRRTPPASQLAITEAVAAARRKTAEPHRRRSGSGEEMAGAGAHVHDAVSRLLAFIETLKNKGGPSVVETCDSPFDLVALSCKAVEHAGRAAAPAKSGKRRRHRGAGARDWPHLWPALFAGVGMICTTNAAFADIAGSDDVFGRILVQLTSGPLVGPPAGGGAA